VIINAVNFMKILEFETCLAHASDVDDMALAHRDSIRSIGPGFYPLSVVSDWEEGLTGALYLRAMESGEVFFIARGTVDGRALVLGFASDYRIEDSRHGTSVYVRGIAARCGIGSALLKAAEAHAVGRGATSIEIEASFAGVEFYRANGFTEIGRGETYLQSGRPIGCVFMRKDLAAPNAVRPDTSGGVTTGESGRP
jgi:ribosomal protein S18 acetylase RimI-like enzyme